MQHIAFRRKKEYLAIYTYETQTQGVEYVKWGTGQTSMGPSAYFSNEKLEIK